LAEAHEAKLTALHVVPTFDPLPVPPATLAGAAHIVYPVSREEVLEGLRRAMDAAGARSSRTSLAADAGDPARTIVDRAVEIRADLIVMGTHGRSGFERFMIGSVAEKVLRKAPCAVLTVPPHTAATSAGDVRFVHVLCPMDFSPSALLAFGFARDFARQSHGTVTLLHVIEWLAEEEPGVHGHFDVPEYRQHLIANARQQLRTLVAAEAGGEGAIQEAVVLGRAHREILRRADDLPADLIVMGAQGRGGLGLTLFGSTTHQIVRAAPCPVLTVRAPGPAVAG
jgi:nucleotide-binding universal stress UspA family protein